MSPTIGTRAETLDDAPARNPAPQDPQMSRDNATRSAQRGHGHVDSAATAAVWTLGLAVTAGSATLARDIGDDNGEGSTAAATEVPGTGVRGSSGVPASSEVACPATGAGIGATSSTRVGAATAVGGVAGAAAEAGTSSRTWPGTR
jgi:hypothetical protein